MYKELYYTEDLENTIEEIVFEEITKIIDSRERRFCKCKICIQDIAAIVLNTTPPKYKNSIVDKLFLSDTEAKKREELQKEVRKKVLDAIEKVSRAKHH